MQLAGDSRAVHAVVGVEELQGGGQIVVHEPLDLGQLGGVCLYLVENILAYSLQAADILGDLLVLDGVIQTLHLCDGLSAVCNHLVQPGVAGGLYIMGTIVTAFEKQLDALFGADAMDISTDISVSSPPR